MDLTRQPPFPPDACPMCGRAGQDGHFCEACIDELERRGIDWEMMDPEEMRAALAAAPQPSPSPASLSTAAPEAAHGEVPTAGAGVRWGTLIIACGVLALVLWGVHAMVGDRLAYLGASERAEVEARLVDVKTSCLRSERYRPDAAGSGTRKERATGEERRRRGLECTHMAIYEYSLGGKTYTYESVPRRTDYEFDAIPWEKSHRHGYYKNGKGEWVRVSYTGFGETLQIIVGALAVCAVALSFIWRELRKLCGRTA